MSGSDCGLAGAKIRAGEELSTQTSESVLFAAGHGFYQFAITRREFDRSLYYNLLMQPSVAIPDHYLLQGDWLGSHLDGHASRDSWVEVGLRNGFIDPYLRRESSSLASILRMMKDADRRGFSHRASDIAERLDRTPFEPRHWASHSNSALFGASARHYLRRPEPPMLELNVDPDDFAGFWRRSREWISSELATAEERSSDLLGSEGLLLSQLIQVSGERLLGKDCSRIHDVGDLLARTKTRRGVRAERDLRVYYTSLCELYNRSLADTLLLTANSPHWQSHVAAMDLWREDLLASAEQIGTSQEETFDITIKMPHPHHLRKVSGDVLLDIRRSASCERFFESLAGWRAHPHDDILRGELVESLTRYAENIMRQVGREIGAFGLRPRFLTKTSDISGALDKAPDLLHGVLAMSAGASTASALLDAAPLALPASMFTLFCLQVAAKHYMPSTDVDVSIGPRSGVQLHADITITRAR